MEKKRIVLFVGLMLVCTIVPFNVIAEDENDPEIVDPEGDIIGKLVSYPQLFSLLKNWKIIDFESWDFIDIVSAWFYERQSEPDFLYTTVKLKDLDLPNLRVIYTLRWMYDGSEYCCCTHVLDNGDRSLFSISSDYGSFTIDGSVDTDKNIVTFKIPKESIANPEPGDVLTNSYAWVGVRFSRETLLTAAIGELALDYTEYGRDYVVRY